MNYQQTLDYLFSKLPMFHRVGAAAYKADLDNTLKIVEILGKPHQKLKCIHVAGTNGKGSSSHMLSAILQQAGYKTGLYTSPHLIDFRERIKINGKMIPRNYVVDFVEKYKDDFAKIQPSFFEWTVGLAFDYFVKEEVDIAIVEVGLGGRLDSTNIIMPVVSLITNISFDHTNLLGDTLEKIAIEKAGIIKPRIPIVISQYQSESGPLFSRIAREQKSPIEFADKIFKVTGSKRTDHIMEVQVLDRVTGKPDVFELDLTGSYQVKNVLGVLCVVHNLVKAGFIIEPDMMKKGLKEVVKLTGFAGRWQILGEKPLIIADTGHNEDGIKQVIENIKTVKHDKLHFVFGAVNDKEITKILKMLPKEANYYFVKASVPRALDQDVLMKEAKAAGLKGKSFSTVKEGLQAAIKASRKNDLVFIGGSTFVVGDALMEF